jgi:fructose-bisphosphate aldolase class II
LDSGDGSYDLHRLDLQSFEATRSSCEGRSSAHVQIKKATRVFLTLHGGSGTNDDDFRKAIAAGINIIHVSTELRVAWKKSLQRSLAADPKDVVPYKILRPVVDSVAQVVGSRLRLFNEKQTIKSAA